jgi:uncharacterized repeat protein (TIGR01451 family)
MNHRVLPWCGPIVLAGLVGAGAGCAGAPDSLTPPDTNKPKIDLSISKTADKDSAQAGASVAFTISVTNLGPITATNVTAGDTLPTGMTYASSSTTVGTYSSTTGIWAIGPLAKDAVSTLTLNATMGTGTAGTWLVNRAGVLANESDSLLANNLAADSVKRVATPPPPPPGDSEPVDPGSGYLWADNFDRYTSPLGQASIAAAMMTDGGCAPGTPGYNANPGNASAQATWGKRTQPNSGDGCHLSSPNMEVITPGRLGSGNALRANVQSDPNHNQQLLTWLSPWSTGWTTYTGSVVIQIWFRISPGGTPAPNGTKWLEAWYVGTGGRVEVSTINSGGHQVFEISNNGRAVAALQPVGPYLDYTRSGQPPALNDGNWHRFTWEHKKNTTDNYPNPGSRDGFSRVWIDGIKVIDLSATAAGITPSGGTKVWCTTTEVDQILAYNVNYLKFPDVFNGADVGFALDHDDLKVWAKP